MAVKNATWPTATSGNRWAAFLRTAKSSITPARTRVVSIPYHLEQVPHIINVRRGGINGSNFTKTQCDSGHEFTPANTRIDANGWRHCRACDRRIHREKKYRYDYRYIYLPNHPLANDRGYIYEHRAVLYDKIGPGPHPCHHCGKTLSWGGIHGIHVDHLNDIPSDNRPGNLVPSCQKCNKRKTRVDWDARRR